MGSARTSFLNLSKSRTLGAAAALSRCSRFTCRLNTRGTAAAALLSARAEERPPAHAVSTAQRAIDVISAAMASKCVCALVDAHVTRSASCALQMEDQQQYSYVSRSDKRACWQCVMWMWMWMSGGCVDGGTNDDSTPSVSSSHQQTGGCDQLQGHKLRGTTLVATHHMHLGTWNLESTVSRLQLFFLSSKFLAITFGDHSLVRHGGAWRDQTLAGSAGIPLGEARS